MNALPLQISSLHFSYCQNVKTLDNISFELKPSSFTILLGSNGAGKTTLFALITRLFGSHQGEIKIFGYDVAKQSEKALAHMGMIFQSNSLDLDLSIEQNLYYFASLHNISKNTTKNYIDKNLPHYLPGCQLKQKIRQLSGGQKRSVELMRALMTQPKLLLLDEPSTGLDIQSRKRFLQLIREQCQQRKVAVLWATHLMDEIADNDIVCMLNHGKIVSHNTVDETLRNTQTHSIKEAFLLLTQSPVQ